MADDPTKTDPPKGDPKTDPDHLGDGGQRALAAERKRANDAEAEKKRLETRISELENKDKPDVERLTNDLAQANTRIMTAENRAMRLEIAIDKKLTPAQVNRLVGSTREELEADADVYLAESGGSKSDPPPPEDDGGRSKPPPSNRPTTDLRAGGDPTQEAIELNPTKLAAAIPRSLI